MRPYCLGLISGVNNKNKIILFSVGICLGERKDNIFRHLSWMFRINESDCDSITSDQGNAIKGAINDLR